MKFKSIVHPSYSQFAQDIITSVEKDRTVEPFDIIFKGKNSANIFLEGNAFGQFQDSSLVTVTFILRDITERKKAAEELQTRLRQETMVARITNLLAGTGEPASVFPGILSIIGSSAGVDTACIFTIDTVTEVFSPITVWNASVVNPLWSHPPNLFFRDIPAVSGIILSGKTARFPNVMSLPETDRTFLSGMDIKSLLALPITIGGQIVGVFAIIAVREKHEWDDNETALLKATADILAGAWRRQLEIDARKQKEREAEQSRLLVIRADRLAAIGTMTAGIVHEITQPLNAINISAQTILYGLEHGWELGGRQIKRSLDLIVEQIQRISTIIANMRAFSRDGLPSERRKDNLNTQVHCVLSMLGKQLKNQVIDVELFLGDISDIYINTQQILQVLMNLVTNARQAFDGIEKAGKKSPLQPMRMTRMSFSKYPTMQQGFPRLSGKGFSTHSSLQKKWVRAQVSDCRSV